MQKSGSLSMVTCIFLAALAAGGCLERPGVPTGPEIGFGQKVSIDQRGVSAVDLLFVIDDSASMEQEQANLATEIRQLVRDLAAPPDRNSDGAPDWAAVQSLRIAVANTDVGTGTIQYPGSHCHPGGDDGMLHGGIFEWGPDEDPDAFADAVGEVVANIGISGCAFEQQLEATARALARARDNNFPRDDALLAIIVVTDEEDCSVADDDRFFGALVGDPNVHCTRNHHLLTRIADLADEIRGPRAPEDIVFAAIAGIPRDISPDATPQQILAHPDMQYMEVDLGSGLEPRRACEFIDPVSRRSLGRASPARRIVELASHFPGSVLHSICTNDFGPAIREIASRIGERVSGVCLARALPDSGGGPVPCTVSVVMPDGEPCSSVPGYTRVKVDEMGREVCEVAQVAPGSGEEGFYYDGTNESCPQLVLTEGAVPPYGAVLSAECFFKLLLELGEQCARHTQCESGWCEPIERVCVPLPATVEDPAPPTG